MIPFIMHSMYVVVELPPCQSFISIFAFHRRCAMYNKEEAAVNVCTSLKLKTNMEHLQTQWINKRKTTKNQVIM